MTISSLKVFLKPNRSGDLFLVSFLSTIEISVKYLVFFGVIFEVRVKNDW